MSCSMWTTASSLRQLWLHASKDHTSLSWQRSEFCNISPYIDLEGQNFACKWIFYYQCDVSIHPITCGTERPG